jgi:ATP-dependent RNA helicase DeaD
MRRGTLRLETIKMVILDEVDVMLNMGFRDDIELILQSTPKERQTVFFSATIPKPIQQLIEKYSRNPQQVRIEQKALTVPTVEQVYYEVDRRYKIELLTRLIDIHDLKLGIIFCNTKRMVDDLVDHLEAQGYMADRLHGDMNQAQRDRVMNKFRKSGLEFLVATDIAARGIDVDDVQVVFNYDLPYDVEDYVHRIGRTGRAGRSGRAISFVAGREMFQIYNIERFTKMKIQRGKPPTAGEVQDAKANVFLDKIRATLQNSDFKREDHLIERLLEEGFSSTDIASALLHHLRVGDGAATTKVTRDDERERPSRPPYREERQDRHSERSDRRPPYENRREDRRDDRRSPSPTRESRPVKASQAPRPAAIPSSTKRDLQIPSSAPVPAPAPETKPPVKETPPVEKTYTDEEILASVQPPPKKAEKAESKPAPKPSRRTPDNQTRLWMNVGEEMGIAPIDIVNVVAGETGLPGKVVGTVDIRERHLFADVASEHVKGIIAKLNRSEIKGHKLKVKVA